MGNVIYDKLNACLDALRKITDFVPDVALILGSGLGDFADNIDVECEVPYSELPGFPVSTVQGHDGKFIFGRLGEVKLVCMKGRVHYYEGYDISDVVLPVRLMKLMGAKVLFLTNAAGGINLGFKAGNLMMIEDQISCFAPNPLVGPNISELGVRFPDMSSIYNKKLNELILDKAKELSIAIKKGVYVQLTGPSYESPAEIRMLRTLGADAVGMSTAVEAIAANHMGMAVCGISCISNMAAGINKEPLSHKDVQEAANIVAKDFSALVESVIKAIKGIEIG